MNQIYAAFVYVVWFLSTYYLVLFSVIIFMHKDELHEKRESTRIKNSKVSIVVPAYNEENKIAHTINSLKKLDYKKLEVIIVNDGSSDNTSKVVRENIKGDKRFIFIDNKINKGKAASMNQGISIAQGKFVACMDADSVVEQGIFEKVLPYFKDRKVGAVTVTVEVKKSGGILHKMIDLEFIIGLSLFLKILSLLNCVFVTPGPFSIFRKGVLDEIGGFDPNNITEDTEIAYRIHKHNYRIETCMTAKVHTLVPRTFRQIYTQRKRWYSGAIQTIIQHRKMFFKKKYGLFAYLTPMNYLVITLGIILFISSTYLGFSRTISNLWHFQYTGYNFFDKLFDWNLDPLNISRIFIIGVTGFLSTIVMMIIGIFYTRNKFSEKKIGMLGFPFMFFLYQIFWIGSILAVIRGKKIKWR